MEVDRRLNRASRKNREWARRVRNLAGSGDVPLSRAEVRQLIVSQGVSGRPYWPALAVTFGGIALGAATALFGYAFQYSDNHIYDLFGLSACFGGVTLGSLMDKANNREVGPAYNEALEILRREEQ